MAFASALGSTFSDTVVIELYGKKYRGKDPSIFSPFLATRTPSGKEPLFGPMLYAEELLLEDESFQRSSLSPNASPIQLRS